MRRCFVAIFLFFVLVVGCTDSGTGTGSPSAGSDNAPPADDTLTIAVIPKATSGEFWETVEVGARAAAEELGVKIRWEGALTETEIAEQNKIIENMVNLGVDGIALAPLNAKAMRKNVAAAVDAGIPVVIFDSSVEGDRHVSFVATDNQAGGRLAAEHMTERLSGEGRVVVMRFVQGTASTEARAQGFFDGVSETAIEVVDDPYPEDGTLAGSKKTASNVFEGHIRNGRLELEGIFACNLYASLGVSAALDDLRKSGIEVNVAFIGFDTSPRLLECLEDGHIDALVSQHPRKMGYLTVDTLVRHLRGESIEPTVDTGVVLVKSGRRASNAEVQLLAGLE